MFGRLTRLLYDGPDHCVGYSEILRLVQRVRDQVELAVPDRAMEAGVHVTVPGCIVQRFLLGLF